MAAVEEARPAVAGAKGLSLHVGVNIGDLGHYGSFRELLNCVNDANAMAELARGQGFEVLGLLADEAGTREAVKQAFAEAARKLKDGDIFLFTFSGHGSQYSGTAPVGHNDVEQDGTDETLVLYDGMMLDDELYEMWHRFAKGVRVYAVLDCCHSETGVRDIGGAPGRPMHGRKRLLSAFDRLNVKRRNADFYAGIFASGLLARELPVECSVNVITACKDDEVADDGVGGGNGLFTQTLLAVWDNGNFQGSMEQFHLDIADFLSGSDQTPGKDWQGPPSPAFAAQRPFTI
jgi:metacaspase-1